MTHLTDLLCGLRAVANHFSGFNPGGPNSEMKGIVETAIALLAPADAPRPLTDWHEDKGNVVWWALGDDGQWLGEPAYIGTPLDAGFGVGVTVGNDEFVAHVGGWPGYHTHWTPHPPAPAVPAPSSVEGAP